MNKQETIDLKILIEDRLANGSTGGSIAEAIAAKYLRIDRCELPEVVEDPGDAYFRVGVLGVMNDADPATYRRIALDNLAAAEHLEQRDTEEAMREERRRGIYESLGGDRDFWVHVGNRSRIFKAVERIRVLEDGTP